jgi:DNA-binding MarR family transcriptional regulator
VLKRLVEDGAATTAELARSQAVRPQSMGAIVATLEEMGLVVRKPHPTDGRQVHLEVTLKGVAVRKSAGEMKRGWLTEAIGKLSKEEQDTLFAAGKIMRRMAESDPK